MSYYPTLKMFEMGTLVLQANYLHDKDLDGIQARTSARPFYLLGSDSKLLKGIHLDGVYERNSSDRGHGNTLTGGFGIRHKDLDISFEKGEGEGPRFFLQMIRNF